MDSTKGERYIETENFINILKHEIPHIEIIGFDERLSTVEAENRISYLKNKKKQKVLDNIDSIAATVILDDYLKTI